MRSEEKRTIYVTNISISTRARDLAYEFERYGKLIRCDIPVPKHKDTKPFAFVEFQDESNAQDAFQGLQGKKFEGFHLQLQWARTKNEKSRHRESLPSNRSRSKSPPTHRHHSIRERESVTSTVDTSTNQRKSSSAGASTHQTNPSTQDL